MALLHGNLFEAMKNESPGNVFEDENQKLLYRSINHFQFRMREIKHFIEELADHHEIVVNIFHGAAAHFKFTQQIHKLETLHSRKGSE